MKLSDRLAIVNQHRKNIPVDVETLASDLGAPVHYAYLDADISGMLEYKNGHHQITVNASDPQTRQRFTIAHEIGHLLAHRDLIGAGVDDDKAYRSTSAGKYHNTAIGPREETEANKLAATILMPPELVDSYVEKYGKNAKSLARLFGVSEHAMSIRIGMPY